jgi:hypothetical protein
MNSISVEIYPTFAGIVEKSIDHLRRGPEKFYVAQVLAKWGFTKQACEFVIKQGTLSMVLWHVSVYLLHVRCPLFFQNISCQSLSRAKVTRLLVLRTSFGQRMIKHMIRPSTDREITKHFWSLLK